MDIIVEPIKVPADTNIIFGMSHFIKSVEDLYEVIVNTVPSAKFAIAFNEASGPCLVRYEGNDERLIEAAKENQRRIGAGHTFLILLKDAFPINVLPGIKDCREVATVYCATANPVQVLLVEKDGGRGVIGVIDGKSPKGIELINEKRDRIELLRKIGYKK